MGVLPKIPGYKIEKKLAEGGMATVYLGIQEKLNRKVAIKILDPSLLKNKVIEIRFLQEAETAANMYHSNIISIFDIGRVDNLNYIVMEYLKETLKEYVLATTGFCLKPGDALRILKPIVTALNYAHSLGIIHRDIKTENIMFRQDGTPVLTDFGIARALDSDKEMTKTGMSLGTPYYMSPEQCRAEGLDGRSDIYSLGVVLFEILTGAKPYDADTPMAVALKHLQEPVPRLPNELSSYQLLIDKMMAKRKEDRVSGGTELIALMDSVHQQAQEPGDPREVPISPPSRRSQQERQPRREPKPGTPPLKVPAPEVVPTGLPGAEPKAKPEAQPVLKTVPIKIPKPAPKPASKPEPKPVPKAASKAAPKTAPKPMPETLPEPELEPGFAPAFAPEPLPELDKTTLFEPEFAPGKGQKPGLEREKKDEFRTIPAGMIITTPISVPAVMVPSRRAAAKKPFSLAKYPVKKIVEIAVLLVLLVAIFVIAFNLGSGSGTPQQRAGGAVSTARDVVREEVKPASTVFSAEFLQQGDQYRADYNHALTLYENKDFEKAREWVDRLKQIKPVPEVLALEEKISTGALEAKESSFSTYYNNARMFLQKQNFTKARENISLAKKIKDSPEVQALEKRIEVSYSKYQEQLARSSALTKEQQQQDDLAYSQASGMSTIEAYRQYIHDFPGGRHIEEAITRLNNLEEADRLKKEAEQKAALARIKLRRTYKKEISFPEVGAMIVKNGFFDNELNKGGSFRNRYELRSVGADAVITDNAADLVWYAGPQPKEMNFKKAEKWVKGLNVKRYGGYTNWRLPTVEEAASLLRRAVNSQGLYIDPVFNDNLKSIWTGDGQRTQTYWVIRFNEGTVYADSEFTNRQVRPVRSAN